MLKIGYIILGLFQLVLRLLTKLTPNNMNKRLTIFKVFLEEGFDVKLFDWSGAFMIALIPGLFEADGTTKKWGGKLNTSYPNDT